LCVAGLIGEDFGSLCEVSRRRFAPGFLGPSCAGEDDPGAFRHARRQPLGLIEIAGGGVEGPFPQFRFGTHAQRGLARS
jgi:hypothetical protein